MHQDAFRVAMASRCASKAYRVSDERLCLLNVLISDCYLFKRFFNDSAYKDYLENAVSFNRKLNEERKMRLPYIDGQTGVAQRHYNVRTVSLEPREMPAVIFHCLVCVFSGHEESQRKDASAG